MLSELSIFELLAARYSAVKEAAQEKEGYVPFSPLSPLTNAYGKVKGALGGAVGTVLKRVSGPVGAALEVGNLVGGASSMSSMAGAGQQVGARTPRPTGPTY